jgi:pyridoxamine 5'-phosphate oxidase
MDNLFEVREEYISQNLDEKSVLPNPINQFKVWFGEAATVKIYEPHAAFLATANRNAAPSGRMILVKAFSDNGFVFFSNYESKKGHQLLENPYATLVFNWADLERQVKVDGTVEKLTPEESDKYFETRPAGSRLGAWASPQSQAIESRKWLEDKHNEFRKQFKHGEVPRPANWGGYNLKPTIIEFWQGRQNRLHDRIEYFLEENIWKIRRLAP